MTLDRIVNGLKSKFARFVRSERGNVAMMFGMTLPVMLAATGAAVDYSRQANARAAMQAAIDATALMISKEAANLTAAQITTKAQSYFNAIYNHPEVGSVTFAATYSPNSGSGASIVLNVTGSMQTDFMKAAGITTMPLNASTTTKWGNIRYRVALALDNTGSMGDADKINQLKLATNQLIADFYAMASSNEDVYISIVPFSKDVNVGADKKNEPWVRWTDWDQDNTHKVCTKPQYTSRSSCQDHGGNWISVPQDHSNWNGCVMDRDQDYDVSNTTPSSVTATMAPAEQYSSCPVPILGMTSVKKDKQVLLDKIDDMTPAGNTNQAIGLAWAWLTHAASGPFPAPAKDANYSYQDVIILLTDGLNTQNRWTSNQNSIDTREATLCSNAKTVGSMKIFAVQVATSGDAQSSMLKNCTSEPNNPNYFSYITLASQMTVKFQNIFKELSKLRVAS
jgi:Flp pilus assembly protein TadG